MAERGPEVGQVLGEYRVERQLDQGGFGTVYLASNLNLPGRKVVVKVIPSTEEDKRAALRHEAMQLVELRHPSVVQVISIGEEPGFLYLIEEYLDGETLAAMVEKGPLGLFEAVRVAGRIADALEAVHEVGLVHRDLKPANIMLRLSKDRGRFVDWLKLIDFGLAFATGRTDAVRAGTPEYVAPETVSQEVGPVTPATDLYSLGCILYELLTGNVPFTGTVEEMVTAHVHSPAPRLGDRLAAAPPELTALVAQLMEKNPSSRPSSAMAVSKELGKIERTLVEGATGLRRLSSVIVPGKLSAADARTAPPTLKLDRAPSTDEALASVRGRSAWPVLVLGVAVALGGVVGWWAWPRGDAESPPPLPPRKVAVVTPVAEPAPPLLSPAPPDPPLAPLVAVAPPVRTPDAAQQLPRVAAPHPGPAVVVEPAPACNFDDRYRDYARRTRAELRAARPPEAVAAFDRADDDLAQALIERDCRKANVVLNQLRRLAGVPLD